MTFLPIVERELRVAARKRGTYLTRVGVGMGAMILGGIAALVALLNPPLRFGTLFFQTLSGVALLYCLGAGRFLTADCLSAEKREETMGLLFLTDLKGYDVVLGKMAATSLSGLYGLLAVLPVLALTLLTGGITNGEFWRVALVLLDTFLFSLAVGIFASALTREFRSAIALNFYVLLALAGALPALAGLLRYFAPSAPLAEGLFLPCPVYTLLQAFDATYKNGAPEFWSSAGFILAMSWLLVALACKIAPRSWQAKPAKRTKKALREAAFERTGARAFRKQLLDQNAYYWRAARPWWKGRVVWAVLGAAVAWLVSNIVSVGWLDETICVVVAVTLNVTFKLWITLEAGQSLAEDVKSGAFELLLPTPLTPQNIVSGQILALRRQFFKPLLVVAGVELFFMGKLMWSRPGDRSFYFCVYMAGILMLAADVVTLSVVAMAASLTEKNITRASLKTARQVLVLPWGIWAGVAAIRQALVFIFSGVGREVSWKFNVGCWFGIGMLVDGLFGWSAWHRLTKNFRELALRQFAPVAPPASLRRRGAKLAWTFREKVWRRPRNRKWFLRLASVLALFLAVGMWENNRSHDPPPEVAVTGPGDATNLQAVAAGEGVYLILPDGSLWRWGKTEGANQAMMPERIGTNRDWSMVSLTGNQRLGLRRDGTLWEWHTDGAETQVGADHDWAEAIGGEVYKVGRKKDGTLWAWGDVATSMARPPSSPTWLPWPPATNHVWKARDFGNGYWLAVDSDGALWAWGLIYLRTSAASGTLFPPKGTWGAVSSANYSEPIQVCRETNWVGFAEGRPQNSQGDSWDLFAAPPNPAESISSMGSLYHTQTPIQVGTNRDWMEVEASVDGIAAVRRDGTLWGWGGFSMYGSSGGLQLPVRNALPAQLCVETDWTGFDHSFGLPLLRNRAGDLWLMRAFGSPPNPAASVTSIGLLVARTAVSTPPEQTINLFRGQLTRHEVHTNGTLWASPIEFSAGGPPGFIRAARPAGPRTDWLAVAKTRMATFGLTADGTLWTWGLNLGEKPRVETRTRLQAVRMAVESVFVSGTRTQGAMMGDMRTYPAQEKPRALMRLVPQEPESAGGKKELNQ